MLAGEVFDLPSEGDLKIVKETITWFKNGENIDAKGLSVYEYMEGRWDGLCPLADFAEFYPHSISRLPNWAIEAGKKEKLAIHGDVNS